MAHFVGCELAHFELSVGPVDFELAHFELLVGSVGCELAVDLTTVDFVLAHFELAVDLATVDFELAVVGLTTVDFELAVGLGNGCPTVPGLTGRLLTNFLLTVAMGLAANIAAVAIAMEVTLGLRL